MFFDVGPGAKVQQLHRDGWCWHRINHLGMNVELASIIALSEFTVENGATLVVPGSHLWEPDRLPKDGEAVPAVMSAGSVVFYLGTTYHSAGANRTVNSWRRGMHLSYVVGWLRTEENNYLVTPLEYVRDLPRNVQAILGYAAHEDSDACARGSHRVHATQLGQREGGTRPHPVHASHYACVAAEN